MVRGSTYNGDLDLGGKRKPIQIHREENKKKMTVFEIASRNRKRKNDVALSTSKVAGGRDLIKAHKTKLFFSHDDCTNLPTPILVIIIGGLCQK